MENEKESFLNVFFFHTFTFLESCFIFKEQKKEFELIGLKSYHNSTYSKDMIEYRVGIRLFIVAAHLGVKQGTYFQHTSTQPSRHYILTHLNHSIQLFFLIQENGLCDQQANLNVGDTTAKFCPN